MTGHILCPSKPFRKTLILEDIAHNVVQKGDSKNGRRNGRRLAFVDHCKYELPRLVNKLSICFQLSLSRQHAYFYTQACCQILEYCQTYNQVPVAFQNTVILFIQVYTYDMTISKSMYSLKSCTCIGVVALDSLAPILRDQFVYERHLHWFCLCWGFKLFRDAVLLGAVALVLLNKSLGASGISKVKQNLCVIAGLLFHSYYIDVQ